MRKIISCLLALMIMLSALAFSGCSSDDVEGAENSLKVYFSALNGFNIKAMEECVAGEEAGDIGFEIEELSDDFRQSDDYKNHIENMMKELSSTFEFTINSNEVVNKDTVKFNITLKCADVNERDMGNYISQKQEQYIMKNPEVLEMDDYEYEETMIGVYADAYKVFLEKQAITSQDFTITVSKVDGKWKVKTSDNKAFFDFLQETFAGSEPVEEEPMPVEETEGEQTEEVEEAVEPTEE